MTKEISDEELARFEKMHECLKLSDGACQKCRMVARIRGVESRINQEFNKIAELRNKLEQQLMVLAATPTKRVRA